MIVELSKNDKIELSRILEGVQGRLDKNLIKLVMDLVFKNRVSIKKEDHYLFSANSKKIPDESTESFAVGSFFGQTYQIGIDLAKKMELKLDPNQKRLLREFTFFLVLFKFEKESKK